MLAVSYHWGSAPRAQRYRQLPASARCLLPLGVCPGNSVVYGIATDWPLSLTIALVQILVGECENEYASDLRSGLRFRQLSWATSNWPFSRYMAEKGTNNNIPNTKILLPKPANSVGSYTLSTYNPLEFCLSYSFLPHSTSYTARLTGQAQG